MNWINPKELPDKMYIIRSPYYPKENLGKVKIIFSEDTCIVYPLKSYKGLHSDNAWLEYWAEHGVTKVEGEMASYWLHKRCCPPGRHNINDILRAHRLKEYNAAVIIDYNKGMCTYDDLWFEEIKEDCDEE